MSPTLHQVFEWIVGFVAREGLLLATVLLLFLVLGGLGRSFGLPDLFWRSTVDSHPRRHQARLLIGFALGVLLAADALILLLVESATFSIDRALFFRLFGWLCIAAGLAVALIWLVGPYRRRHGDTRDPHLFEAALLPAGTIIGSSAFYWLFPRVPGWAPPWFEGLVRRMFLKELRNPELLELHVGAGLLVVMGTGLFVVLAWLSRTRLQRHIYPASSVCVLLATIGAVHGFVAYRWPGAQIPMYLLLFALYVCLDAIWRRARVPTLESPKDSQAPSDLLPDRTALEAWRALHESEPPVLVVLAADGGGVRSALWTATVLTRLEKIWPAFARHVRLVTGASGGMLGAAVWTATLRDGSPSPDHVSGKTTLTRRKLLEIVEKGGLSAVAAGLVFRDILPSPLRFGPDRGRRLELAWESHCPELAEPVLSLARGEEEGWRPSLVFSPMLVEDGRRLLVANLDLDLLCNSGPIGNRPARYSLGGVQLFRRLPATRGALQLSTAVRLQANFPWILPSTELPPLGTCQPRLRAVDAGYYDETGVDLACLWILENRRWLEKHTAGVLLIQNRDTSSISRLQLRREHRPFWQRGLDGVFTPLSAALRARDSTTWYRNDATVADLAARLDGGTKQFFSTVIFELSHEASLSWSLTCGDARRIERHMSEKHNRTAVEDMRAWCADHGVSFRA